MKKSLCITAVLFSGEDMCLRVYGILNALALGHWVTEGECVICHTAGVPMS